MEQNLPGAQGWPCTPATVSSSTLYPIFRSSAGPGSSGLPGLSKRPGGRLETTPNSRLGVRSRCPRGRTLTTSQDMFLETGVYLRYQRPFLVPELRRAIDLGWDRAIWSRWKDDW